MVDDVLLVEQQTSRDVQVLKGERRFGADQGWHPATLDRPGVVEHDLAEGDRHGSKQQVRLIEGSVVHGPQGRDRVCAGLHVELKWAVRLLGEDLGVAEVNAPGPVDWKGGRWKGERMGLLVGVPGESKAQVDVAHAREGDAARIRVLFDD